MPWTSGEHEELSRYVGRQLKWIVLALVALFVLAVMFVIFVIIPAAIVTAP